MDEKSLNAALAMVPPGSWAVGVSGGADSVALLGLLRRRGGVALHVVHLDHQLRGEQSTQDARFVAELAAQWQLRSTIARRDEIEPLLKSAPTNPSARYRALRLALYRQVIDAHHLKGVILAHHADDQVETIFQRFLRSASYVGVTGMEPRAVVDGLLILRPLLSLRRERLREYLVEHRISWREDPSNQSEQYLRNRLRKTLSHWPELDVSMLQLAAACGELRAWTKENAPVFGERLNANHLARLPGILAGESIRRWLADRGMPPQQIDAGVVRRLLGMATDAAAPARQDFPGGLSVRRKAGEIFIERR